MIGGDDIKNEPCNWRVVSRFFSMFVYIPVRFLFALIGGDLPAQSTGCHREVELKFQKRSCISSPSFFRPAARAPRRACSQAFNEPKSTLFLFSSLIYRHYNKFDSKEYVKFYDLMSVIKLPVIY